MIPPPAYTESSLLAATLKCVRNDSFTDVLRVFSVFPVVTNAKNNGLYPFRLISFCLTKLTHVPFRLKFR